MKEILRKLFNVYPGEEKNAFYFTVLGFIWSLGVSLSWKNADALFILNVGADKLPVAYTIIACSMILIAWVLLYAYDKYAAHRIFLTHLTIGIVFYTAIYFCVQMGIGMENKMLWYALRIFGWSFFCVVNTNYWTFIDQFYHSRDSKRLFALFSSSIFIGFGVTGASMQSGLPDLQIVSLIIIGILIAAFLWIIRIVKQLQPIHSEHQIDVATPSDESLGQIIRSILQSKFTLCLMMLNLLIFVSFVLTEYNYMVAFQERFASGPEIPVEMDESSPLMQFIGKCVLAVSFFNLIFGLFFYSRFLRRFGLGGMLFITPTILVTTYIGWGFSDALIYPLMAFFVVESTILVVDDNNFNLLLNGVPPKLKYKIRVFIESFFEPVGTLTSALILSLFAPFSRVIALGVALVVLAMSMIIRKLYPHAVYRTLMENAVHFEKTPKEWLQSLSKRETKDSEAKLLSILQLGDPKAFDFALEGMIDFADLKITEKFLTALDSAPPLAKEIFIEKLPGSVFAFDPRVIDHLISWDLDDCESGLKGTLHLYLAKIGLLSPQKALVDLKSDDSELICAGLIAMKKSGGFSSANTTIELRTFASQYLQDLLGSEDERALLMGLQVLSVDAHKEDINILVPYLRHESLLVARKAASTIADVASSQYAKHAKTLLHYVTTKSDNEFRLSLLRALGRIGDTSLVKDILLSSVHLRPNERRQIEKITFRMGLKTVPSLLSITKDTDLHDRSRLLAGKILGRLALSQLKVNLPSIIKQEIVRANFYFFQYHTIQEANPTKDLRVLKDALLSGYHSVIDFIIQMLGMAGEIEDSELLSRSMRSSNPKIRSQVIETLERTCDTTLFRLLQPLVDELPLSVKLKGSTMDALSLNELLAILRKSPSLTDQVAAAAISASENLPEWRATLKQQMRNNEEIFNHFAYELLET